MQNNSEPKCCLRRRLAKPEVTVGSWIQLGQAAIAEIMAAAGYDWIVVDLEHSVISLREAEEMIRIIRMSGVDPLVSLSHNDPVQIKRVMDAGAEGIIVPMVKTAAEIPPRSTRCATRPTARAVWASRGRSALPIAAPFSLLSVTWVRWRARCSSLNWANRCTSALHPRALPRCCGPRRSRP